MNWLRFSYINLSIPLNGFQDVLILKQSLVPSPLPSPPLPVMRGTLHIALVRNMSWQNLQNRVQNFGTNSRTGISKAYDFPEQVKFIPKRCPFNEKQWPHAYLFQNRCVFFQIFFQNRVKKFLGSKLHVYISTVTPSSSCFLGSQIL